MTDNKNTILAIVLSAVVLIAWQFFFAMPQEKARQEKLQAEQQKQQQAQQQPGKPAAAPAQPGPAQAPGQAPQTPGGRRRQPRRGAEGLAARRRSQPTACKARSRSKAAASTIWRWSSSARRSIRSRRRSCCCRRPAARLRSTPNSAGPMPSAALSRCPHRDTVWKQVGSGALAVGHPVTLDLRQRPGHRVPPHHHGRQQVPVHHQGRGGEQEREPGLALSLRADLAPRHAADARLLHPA